LRKEAAPVTDEFPKTVKTIDVRRIATDEAKAGLAREFGISSAILHNYRDMSTSHDPLGRE
jgi:hypothetical protein